MVLGFYSYAGRHERYNRYNRYMNNKYQAEWRLLRPLQQCNAKRRKLLPHLKRLASGDCHKGGEEVG